MCWPWRITVNVFCCIVKVVTYAWGKFTLITLSCKRVNFSHMYRYKYLIGYILYSFNAFFPPHVMLKVEKRTRNPQRKYPLLQYSTYNIDRYSPEGILINRPCSWTTILDFESFYIWYYTYNVYLKSVKDSFFLSHYLQYVLFAVYPNQYGHSHILQISFSLFVKFI